MKISYYHTLNPSKGMGTHVFGVNFSYLRKRTSLRPNPSANLISVKRVDSGTRMDTQAHEKTLSWAFDEEGEILLKLATKIIIALFVGAITGLLLNLLLQMYSKC